jgi:hypothetical protein
MRVTTSLDGSSGGCKCDSIAKQCEVIAAVATSITAV